MAKKKAGQQAATCKIYASRQRREINKVKKLIRHLNREAGDNCALEALDRVSLYIDRAVKEMLAVGYKGKTKFI